jgi:hypothetical protein
MEHCMQQIKTVTRLQQGTGTLGHNELSQIGTYPSAYSVPPGFLRRPAFICSSNHPMLNFQLHRSSSALRHSHSWGLSIRVLQACTGLTKLHTWLHAKTNKRECTLALHAKLGDIKQDCWIHTGRHPCHARDHSMQRSRH